MFKRVLTVLTANLLLSLAVSESSAMEKLTVMISGGFSPAYHEVLPQFERDTGIAVTTLSGASQGTGPKTIKSQLEQGAEVDVVILSKEGLKELMAAGRIATGSEAEVATVMMGAAVRAGAPKPDISSVEAFKQTLLNAKLLAMPGSTGGIFMKNEVFPKLGIADRVSMKFTARGTESTAMLAAGEADLVIGPVSEIISQGGIELVGPLPKDVQLAQIFTASMVKTSHNPDAAKKLIEFLVSDRTTAAIKKSGMEPIGNRRE